MDENTETGQEQASTELPIPKLETPSAGGTPSVDTAAIVKQVTENLRKELRMAQSTKDKDIAAIKKTLGIGDLAELESMGVPIPDNVKLEYRLREMEQNRQTPQQPSTSSSSGSGEALTVQDVSEVIAKYKLDANSPQVLEKLRATYRSKDHFQATMAELIVPRDTQPPSPADLVQAPAKGGSATPSQQALAANYKKEILDARGKGARFGDAIKDKYRQQGLDVDSISFTV